MRLFIQSIFKLTHPSLELFNPSVFHIGGLVHIIKRLGCFGQSTDALQGLWLILEYPYCYLWKVLLYTQHFIF